jgi:hypothetical protein
MAAESAGDPFVVLELKQSRRREVRAREAILQSQLSEIDRNLEPIKGRMLCVRDPEQTIDDWIAGIPTRLADLSRELNSAGQIDRQYWPTGPATGDTIHICLRTFTGCFLGSDSNGMRKVLTHVIDDYQNRPEYDRRLPASAVYHFLEFWREVEATAWYNLAKDNPWVKYILTLEFAAALEPSDLYEHTEAIRPAKVIWLLDELRGHFGRPYAREAHDYFGRTRTAVATLASWPSSPVSDAAANWLRTVDGQGPGDLDPDAPLDPDADGRSRDSDVGDLVVSPKVIWWHAGMTYSPDRNVESSVVLGVQASKILQEYMEKPGAKLTTELQSLTSNPSDVLKDLRDCHGGRFKNHVKKVGKRGGFLLIVKPLKN